MKPFDRQELLARVRAALRTKIARDELAAEAVTDSLTGLLNRGHLTAAAVEHVALAARTGRPLSCLMIDLDHFKAVNDTYGHAAGDAVLSETARCFARSVRRSDVLVRYGGEEFVVLLPETDITGALTIAARLRKNLEAAPVAFTKEDGQAVENRCAPASAWRPGRGSRCRGVDRRGGRRALPRESARPRPRRAREVEHSAPARAARPNQGDCPARLGMHRGPGTDED